MHRRDDALVLLRAGDRRARRESASRICSGSAPMQPVTMTLPFSASASPIASSDSALALSRKPQVLTMTTSAPSWRARELVALGAQVREDALGIDQRLGAAEADEGDDGRWLVMGLEMESPGKARQRPGSLDTRWHLVA